MKKLIDIFVPDQSDNPVLLSIMTFPETAEWATTQNCIYIDERLKQCFSEKPISPAFQKNTKTEILIMIGDYLQSMEYSLNGYYNSTIKDYNPIENYNMVESGRDESRGTSSGDSTDNTTTYDNSNDHKTAHSVTSGTLNNTDIHSFSRSGNIGVTTTQQMLEQERKIVAFDFIQYVADLINEHFCCSFWIPDRSDIYEEMIYL